MAKRKVNKSALIKDYLGKFPNSSPKEIAEQIKSEKKVSVSANFVSSIKSDLKKEGPAASTASGNGASAPAQPKRKRGRPKKSTTTSKKPASNGKPAAPAAKSGSGVANYVANLKSAAAALGKDEAKKIIDLL